MNETKQDIAFPQVVIKRAVESAVKTLYQIDWDSHVVRQHRILNMSKLQFIDYAVPCFELAKLTGMDAATVANDVLLQIQQDDLLITSFKSETISGYINFEVPEDFLKLALLRTIEWFKSPQTLHESGVSHEFLVSGPTIGLEAQFALTQRACCYISELYKLMGVKYAMRNLVCDISEDALQQLANEWLNVGNASQNSALDQMRFRRAFESYVIQENGESGANQIVDLLQQVHATFKNGDYASSKDGWTDVFESDIAAAVQVFLDDEANKDSNPSLIRDAVSSALYYSKGDSVVALRSAKGVLYKSSFIIYFLTEIVKEVSDSGQAILIAPSRNDLIIRDFLQNSLNKEAVVYFDPRVSQADIQEIAPSIESIASHFQNITESLGVVRQEDFFEPNVRQSILSLIDTPVMLDVLIGKDQIPAIFDLLNQSIQSLAAIRR